MRPVPCLSQPRASSMRTSENYHHSEIRAIQHFRGGQFWLLTWETCQGRSNFFWPSPLALAPILTCRLTFSISCAPSGSGMCGITAIDSGAMTAIVRKCRASTSAPITSKVSSDGTGLGLLLCRSGSCPRENAGRRISCAVSALNGEITRETMAMSWCDTSADTTGFLFTRPRILMPVGL